MSLGTNIRTRFIGTNIRTRFIETNIRARSLGINIITRSIGTNIRTRFIGTNITYNLALVVYASTFMIVSLSIDRVDAIARPMNFTRKATTVRVLVNAAWITSGILSIPSFLLFDTYSHTNGKQYCMMNLNETWHWQLYTTLVALTAFIIPALIIVICYSIILFVIWDKGRGFHNSYNGSKCRGKSQSAVEGNKGIIPQAKIKTIKMTLIIVCVFVLSWSPYFVFNLIDVYSNKTKTTTQYAVTSLVQSLAPINSAANPIIYGVFGTSICQNLRRIPCIGYLYKWFCKCRIKRHNFNFRTSHRQSEQTNVDVTSAKYVIVTKRGYRYLVKSNLKHDDTTQQNGQNTLPTSNNTLKNDEAEKTEKCVAHDVVSSPRTQNPSVCHFRRRPSGLPLANRKMTDQETILLETYRSNGKSSVADDNSSLNEDNSLDNKTYCYSQVYNKNRLSGTRQVSGSDDDIMFDKHKMEETVLV
ncbi:cardioacceleratory peptide receptor-like [Ruditapes philippinarum]|uniref:cardioacceleratory peptide receptor-like n=1 Tax=Ruditapes philippinarum TaxID=129788 RepID=UPI00295AC0A5|nr:cardioacceleratory peptide receptor-like [Ruditapes philippinarum]